MLLLFLLKVSALFGLWFWWPLTHFIILFSFDFFLLPHHCWVSPSLSTTETRTGQLDAYVQRRKYKVNVFFCLRAINWDQSLNLFISGTNFFFSFQFIIFLFTYPYECKRNKETIQNAKQTLRKRIQSCSMTSFPVEKNSFRIKEAEKGNRFRITGTRRFVVPRFSQTYVDTRTHTEAVLWCNFLFRTSTRSSRYRER